MQLGENEKLYQQLFLHFDLKKTFFYILREKENFFVFIFRRQIEETNVERDCATVNE